MISLTQSIYSFMRFVGIQSWIRWGLRYRFFCILPSTNHEFTVPFFGTSYSGNMNNFIDRSVFFYGAHEREAMLYMASRIPKDGIVLDVGANVGHHSLFFSTKAREVHAFEPNPRFRMQFERFMNDNNVKNVHLHQVGLGDSTSTIHYYAPTGDNQGIGSFVAEHNDSNMDIGTLPVVRGDDIVKSLGLERVDFIKIDVERYEESVLIGLQETLRKFKPIVVLEYAEADFKSRDTFLSLIQGYVPYVLKVNTPKFFFFNIPIGAPVPFDFSHSHAEMLLEPEPIVKCTPVL